MTWLDTDSYIYEERFWVFLTLITATWSMFFHRLVNCTFKVYFFTVYLALSFVQFYWSCTSLLLVTLSVLSLSLFLLSWGTCCCIFVLLVCKDIVPLPVFGQLLRAARFFLLFLCDS